MVNFPTKILIFTDDNNENQGNNSNNGYYDPDTYNYDEGSSGSIYDNGGVYNE